MYESIIHSNHAYQLRSSHFIRIKISPALTRILAFYTGKIYLDYDQLIVKLPKKNMYYDL